MRRGGRTNRSLEVPHPLVSPPRYGGMFREMTWQAGPGGHTGKATDCRFHCEGMLSKVQPRSALDLRRGRSVLDTIIDFALLLAALTLLAVAIAPATVEHGTTFFTGH